MLGLDKGTVNVIQLSITFMLQFFAYMSQEFIQEPLIETLSHSGTIDKHAGYNSFAIMYLFFTVSCLVTTPLVEKISARWSMVLGLITFMTFQIGFLHINTLYLYVSSAFLGIGSSLTWIGQGKYLTENCTGATIERNSSMMWVILKLSLLTGGVFLYFLFQHQTLRDVVKGNTINYVCIIFLTIYLLAIINTTLLPTPAYKPEIKEVETIIETLFATYKILATYPMSLLAIIFIYAGFSRSFWIAIFPTCIKFTSKLGANTTKLLALSCIASGIGQVSSGCIMTFVGSKARKIGRDLIVVLAVGIHLVTFFAIYLFFPNDAPLRTTEKMGIFPPKGINKRSALTITHCQSIMSVYTGDMLAGFKSIRWDEFFFAFQITCNLVVNRKIKYTVLLLEHDTLSWPQKLTNLPYTQEFSPGTYEREFRGWMNGDELFSDGYSVSATFNHDCTTSGERVEYQIQFAQLCPIRYNCRIKYNVDLTNHQGYIYVNDKVIDKVY